MPAPAAASTAAAVQSEVHPAVDVKVVSPSCRGRSKFRPLRRRRRQASEHRQSKGQKGLSACRVWGFGGTRSAPVTAAVAGFYSAPWPEFGPPHTARPQETVGGRFLFSPRPIVTIAFQEYCAVLQSEEEVGRLRGRWKR